MPGAISRIVAHCEAEPKMQLMQAQRVGRMWSNTVAAKRVPDAGSAPSMHGSPVVDVPWPPRATAGIAAVRLEARIASPGWAFLGALSGDDENTSSEEAILVADDRRPDIDLEGGATPADRKIRRDLGKGEPCPWPTGAAGAHDAMWRLEEDPGRGGFVSQHLPLEAALAPGSIERHVECVGRGRHIGTGHRPIHEGSAAAIDLVVMQLDAPRVRAGLQQAKQAGEAVLAARGEDQDVVVAGQIRLAAGRQGGPPHPSPPPPASSIRSAAMRWACSG